MASPDECLRAITQCRLGWSQKTSQKGSAERLELENELFLAEAGAFTIEVINAAVKRAWTRGNEFLGVGWLLGICREVEDEMKAPPQQRAPDADRPGDSRNWFTVLDDTARGFLLGTELGRHAVKAGVGGIVWCSYVRAREHLPTCGADLEAMMPRHAERARRIDATVRDLMTPIDRNGTVSPLLKACARLGQTMLGHDQVLQAEFEATGRLEGWL